VIQASPRAYRSPLRQEQAGATRRAIVAAAHDLFVEVGYASTTIDAVAERAGVSRKTVFTAVGGKSVLLKLALDWALVGDDEPIPMAERAEVRKQFAQTDPTVMIHMWSHWMAEIESRAARLALVMAAAADADPAVAEVHEHSEAGRITGAKAFAVRLAKIGGLRTGLDVDRAGTMVALLTEPLIYNRLVVRAGWTLDEYADWLEQSARAALMPP
jgi:AcrR family transcriptional regulator